MLQELNSSRQEIDCHGNLTEWRSVIEIFASFVTGGRAEKQHTPRAWSQLSRNFIRRH